MTGRRADRGSLVLLVAVALHLISETALAPFYPALFRAAYGVTELSATGAFVTACRVAVVAALPLWGRAARRWPLEQLVIAGQAAAVLLAGGLALAPSYLTFCALGVALVSAKAVVLLAYPVIARRHPDGVQPAVRLYVAVFHAATVLAALLGLLIVSAPDPRAALPLLAAVEAFLLVFCVLMLRGTGRPAAAGPSDAQSTVPSPGSASPRHLAGVVAYLLVTTVAIAVVRPFFTQYAVTGGADMITAALLFLLPSVAALAVLPWAMALHARAGTRILPTALIITAVGLAAQALTTDPLGLALGRLVFGAGLGLGQFALDERVLAATGTDGPAYSTAAAARSAGLFLAPLLATATATANLAGPLLLGALLAAGLAALAGRTIPPVSSVPSEVNRRADHPARTH